MTDTPSAPTASSRWWVAAFLTATFGIGALKATGVLTGPLSTVLFLVGSPGTELEFAL